jgi:hypothetical protein
MCVPANGGCSFPPGGVQSVSDESLMDCVKKGSEACACLAYAELYRRWNSTLVGWLMGHFGRDRNWAEEIAQQTWFQIWKRRAQWRCV